MQDSIIPSIIFSGAIGACIALFGTYLQNRANRKRQQELLENDRELKRLDRELNLKREIFLQAANTVSAMNTYLRSFFDLNMNVQQQTELLLKDSGSLQKVALVANNETLEAIDNLYYCFAMSNAKLNVERLKFISIQSDIEILESELESAHQMQDFIITTYKNTPNIPQNQEVIVRLSRDFDNLTAEIEKLNDEIKKRKIKLLEYQRDLFPMIASIMDEFTSATAEATLLIRKELNLPIDEELYRRKVKEFNQKVISQGQEFMDDFYTEVFNSDLIKKI